MQDGASPARKKKIVKKSRAKESPNNESEKGPDGKALHPELVTDFIDRVKMSVIVIGVLSLVLVILAFAYLSNPEAVYGFVHDLIDPL